MKYFTHKSQKLSKIGIGTWGIGGFAEKDNTVDEERQIEAIVHMLENGLNYVMTNVWYAESYSSEIFAKAIKRSKIERKDVFICLAIYLKEGKGFQKSIEELDQFLNLIDSEYVDTIEFSGESYRQSSSEEINGWLENQLNAGKTRFVSITNAEPKLLKNFHQKFGSKVFSHEVPYSLEVRTSETEGMIPYANENDILTVAFQPLRRNRTAKRSWPLLVELASKYNKTQNQIILNWITSKGILPIIKSETIAHINENIAAIEFGLQEEDIEKLDSFTPPGYIPPKVDWQRIGDGVTLDQFPNIFDEEYDRQLAKK